MLTSKFYGMFVGSAILALIALHLTPQTVHAPLRPHQAHAISWSVGTPVTVPSLDNVDVRPMLVNNGSTFLEIYADGSTNVKRWQCTSLDSCSALPDGVLDSSFNHPYGDDRYWAGPGILYNGVYYSAFHVEFHYHSTNAPNFSWMRRIDLGVSSDLGAHWHDAGTIIASDFSTDIADYPSAPAFQAGPGDMALFADWGKGFAYLSYTTFWASVTDGSRQEVTDIARCPIASITDINCWHKFDYGGWTQPGNGGHNAPIFSGEDNAAISWDSALNEYVAIGHSSSYSTFISTATSLDSENWTPPQHFISDSLLTPGFYIWLTDENGDPFHLDADIRIYEAANDWGGNQTTYVPVTFSDP